MKRYKCAADIRVATVGYGPSFNVGRYHLQQMQAVGMTPTAVADIDPARLEVAAQEFPGIHVWNSAREMLENDEIDLAAVCTPHNVHAELAILCLEAGCHVVTEKPFAVTTDECDAMIAAARRNGVMLSTYHNRHWDGCIMQAVKMTRSGLIGDIVRIRARLGRYAPPRDWWRSSKSISGGILYDWGAHFMEYALQLVDAEIVEVMGTARYGYWRDVSPWGEDANEDEAAAVVRFSNGVWMSLTISSIDTNPGPWWFEITGTHGTYSFNGSEWEAVVREKGGALAVHRGPNPRSEQFRFYQNIAAHLVNGEPLIITPEWARRPIHVLDLACKSAEAGRSIPAWYR